MNENLNYTTPYSVFYGCRYIYIYQPDTINSYLYHESYLIQDVFVKITASNLGVPTNKLVRSSNLKMV